LEQVKQRVSATVRLRCRRLERRAPRKSKILESGAGTERKAFVPELFSGDSAQMRIDLVQRAALVQFSDLNSNHPA